MVQQISEGSSSPSKEGCIIHFKLFNYQSKLTSKYKPIVCTLKNCNLNSREKFEPGPLKWYSARLEIWRSEVEIPAQVRFFFSLKWG